MNKQLIQRVNLELTKKCNLRCPACNRNYKHLGENFRENFNRYYTQDFPIIKINELNEALPKWKYVDLGGHHCEPTLHPQFLEFIKTFKKLNKSILLFTNGTTHTPKWWHEFSLLLDETDEIIFSIDGASQEVYEQYRINGSLSKVFDNFQAMKKTFYSSWQFIVFDINQHQKEEAKRISKEMEFSEIQFIYSFLFDDEKIHPIYDNGYIDIEPQIETLYNLQLDIIHCRAEIEKFIHIDAMGNVYPCCSYVDYFSDSSDYLSIYRPELNLFETDVEDVLKNLNNLDRKTRNCYRECSKISQKLSTDNFRNFDNRQEVFVWKK